MDGQWTCAQRAQHEFFEYFIINPMAHVYEKWNENCCVYKCTLHPKPAIAYVWMLIGYPPLVPSKKTISHYGHILNDQYYAEREKERDRHTCTYTWRYSLIPAGRCVQCTPPTTITHTHMRTQHEEMELESEKPMRGSNWTFIHILYIVNII